MLTNSSMTHYHRALNKTTRLEEWARYVYSNVMWQGGKGTSLNKGLTDANDIKVRIPYSQEIDIANFSRGDIIVQGVIDKDITTQSDLIKYDTYNIMSIRENNYSKLNPHIHLEGK